MARSRRVSSRTPRRVLLGLMLIGMALAAFVPTAQAAITPSGALAIANAIASPSANVTGASFVAQPGGTPDGVSTTPLTSFPTDGSSFGVLTSGNVSVVGSAATFANTNDGGGNVRGNTDMDVSILKIDLSVPASANCLTFDFRFLSEEYPGYVGTQFNDAFIAELDSSTWTTAGSNIIAPNNFAFDSSHNVVSINSTGLGGMSAANGAGTAYDGGTIYSADLGFAPPNGDGPAGGATVLLHASSPITPGAHSLYLSIFDQGDQILDSAVFLDNLVVGFVPNPAANCVPGAQPVNFKLSLTPATATNPTFTSHTVTATLTDSSNNPVGPGAPIEFTVTGPNATTGTSLTNASGVATFTYTGTHEGTDLISACYKDGAPICLAVATVTKTWTDPLIAATGSMINAVEGIPFSGAVATFHDPDPTSTAGEYSATINWGDLSPPTVGTITGSGGNFTVSGTHTYAEEGPPLPFTVTVTDLDNPSNNDTARSTANVADAPLTASGMSLLSGPTYAGPVAHFTDANVLGTAADFTATIDWGDATPLTAGTVTGGGGSYTVNGVHAYTALGNFTIHVHIVDDGGSTADATSTILIFATTAGGSFVIGDGNAAVGTNVTFWGAQWWKLNTLSGGSAPAAFKGFESDPASVLTCSTNWTADPGDSAPPPSGPLPAFMAVLVSSSVSKSGSTISGDTPHIVIVQTNPGYDANPGHAGTGTVVATVC